MNLCCHHQIQRMDALVSHSFKISILLLMLLASHSHSKDIVLSDRLPTMSIGELPSLIEPTRIEPATLTGVPSITDWLHAEYSLENYASSLRPSPFASWHKVTLLGYFPDEEPREFYLTLNNHVIRHLDIYLFEQEQLIKTSKLGLISSNRESLYDGVNFSFKIKNHQQLTLLIRKQNNGPGILPLTIRNSEQFQTARTWQYVFWGSVISILCAMALFNSFIYITRHSATYIWYLCFHAICFTYLSALHGFGFLLWPTEVQIFLAQNIMPMNFMLLWVITQFSSSFLDSENNASWHHKHLYLLNWIYPLGFITSFFIPEYITIPVFALLQVMGSAFCISMGISAFQNQHRPAFYFLIAWSFVVTGATIGIATYTSLLPSNIFTLHGFLIGTIIELLLLSVALADNLKFLGKRTLSKAYLNPYTGLPNYSFLKNYYPHQLNKYLLTHQSLSLVIIDIHGFRELAGLLGPQIPSQAYQQFLRKINTQLGTQSWPIPVTMPSGHQSYLISLPDERIMLLANTQTTHTIKDVQNYLLSLCETPIDIDNIENKITFVLGSTEITQHNKAILECFRQAQLALITAEHKNTQYMAYNEEHDIEIKDRLSLLADLRQAISEDQFSIEIQPQVNIHTGKILSGEVLARWINNDKKVGPHIFIPLAEESGLIGDISCHILKHACQWLQSKQGQLPKNFQLSINLSAIDFKTSGLHESISNITKEYNISPNQILFEITESVTIDNPKHFFSAIARLKAAGFTIAIDDFGTGYSSMTYLQKMNADEVKLDISFIRNIHRSTTNQRIALSIIQLAHSMNMRVIAEGIEIEEELEWLKTAECSTAQGYYWSKPLAPEEFFLALKENEASSS